MSKRNSKPPSRTPPVTVEKLLHNQRIVELYDKQAREKRREQEERKRQLEWQEKQRQMEEKVNGLIANNCLWIHDTVPVKLQGIPTAAAFQSALENLVDARKACGLRCSTVLEQTVLDAKTRRFRPLYAPYSRRPVVNEEPYGDVFVHYRVCEKDTNPDFGKYDPTRELDFGYDEDSTMLPDRVKRIWTRSRPPKLIESYQ